MLKHIISSICLVLLFASLGFAQQFECNGHVALGIPSQADQYLCRDGYAAGYSYKAKQPFWVAYRLTEDSVAPSLKRTNNFQEDEQIPLQYRATLDDFRKSGYDRGHLVPNAAMDFSRVSMEQAFLLSNMSPQLPGFNRQGWKYTEEYVREWARARGELYVVTGPVFRNTQESIGDGVLVPSHFFKVVYDPKAREMIGFAVAHTKYLKDQVPQTLASVDDIESFTGMDFFHVLEDRLEGELESAHPAALW